MSPAATMTMDTAQRVILDAADALFYERGIAGVGMSEIRDASGVSLRRLYSLYPSKRELVAAWLEDRHRRWMLWFTIAIDRHLAAGVHALLAPFDALSEWAVSPGYRGCAFLNSLAETTEIDDTHRAIIADHKRSLIDHLAVLMARDHPESAAWLPAALGVLIDGAIIQSTVFDTDEPIHAARRAASELLECRS